MNKLYTTAMLQLLRAAQSLSPSSQTLTAAALLTPSYIEPLMNDLLGADAKFATLT